MGYIYIMTNPRFPEIKIGYANNVKTRKGQFDTGVPEDYQVYATYEVKERLQDKKLHKLIDSLNPKLRFDKKKEFYSCSPEQAYEWFRLIAQISGTLDNLSEPNLSGIKKQKGKERKADFSFKSAGIPVGSMIEYKRDHNIKAKVEKDNKVSLNSGKPTSISDLAWKLTKRKWQPQGPRFFMYEGETLSERRERMEEEGTYK